MIIDLFHNKIVKDTATDAFVDSFMRVLVPMLEDKYGDMLEAVTMYEDYLADGFTFEGEWYYPLSLKLAGESTFTAWVKWPVNKKTFKNSIPYAYIGEGDIDFSFAGFLPAGFADKLRGRNIDYDRSAIKLSVEALTDDVTLLVGKYSQTFVDELARQITVDLCRAAGVEDLGTSTMELQLVFAPGTYLEHTSESVTYRRLLLVDKGCQARDFWVKWTRLDGKGGFRVSDTVSADTVKFVVGEDVKQKIREKEFRFLAGANPSKYQAAMGKKTVTEWRDIIKRAIKRGELTKVEVTVDTVPVVEEPTPTFEAVDTRIQDDMSDQLRALLDSFGVSTAAAEEPAEEPEDTYDVVAELARSVLGKTEPEEVSATEDDTDEVPFDIDEPEFEVEIEEAPEEPEEETEAEADEPEFEVEVEVELDSAEEEPEAEEPEAEPRAFDESKPEKIVRFNFDAIVEEADEPEEEIFSMGESDGEEESVMAEPRAFDEDAIRREIEARVRREYEAELRARAEREAEELRLEHERLKAENERLSRLAKEAEERQRAELEAKMRLEAEERARIAEAARLAVEEQKRLEAERAAQAERERLEAIERENERLRKEEEARRLAEERRIVEERIKAEEEEKRRAEEMAKARPSIITKQAKILFRYNVDANILKRIKEVVEKTLIDNHKETVNIHIKAFPVDQSSITLEIKLPDTEMELLVNMMKALGGASMGITKIILE